MIYRRKPFEFNGVSHGVFEIRASKLEEFAWQQVLLVFHQPEVFIEKYLCMELQDPEKLQLLKQNAHAIQKSIAEIEVVLERVYMRWEKGKMSEEKYDERNLQLRRELKNLKDKQFIIEESLITASRVDIEVKALQSAAQKFQYNLENINRRGKEILCNMLIESIEVIRKELPIASNQKRKKYHVDVKFNWNFNPSSPWWSTAGGYNENALVESLPSLKDIKNEQVGGTTDQGTAKIVHAAELLLQGHMAAKNGHRFMKTQGVVKPIPLKDSLGYKYLIEQRP